MPILQPYPLPVQNSAIEIHTLKGVIHLATVLTESYERFWNLRPEVNALLGFTCRSPEAIVADLNSNYDLAIERNIKHYEMATTVNEWLVDAGQSPRVPTAMPEGYSYDGVAFTYTEPASPITTSNEHTDTIESVDY
jgi:hypothetical protein